DGNLHPRLQLLLDLEAFRRLDVLQVDAAEGRLQRGDRRDHQVDIVRLDLDVEDVDAGEFLEQGGLALHPRLGGPSADIAEPEYGRRDGERAGESGGGG